MLTRRQADEVAETLLAPGRRELAAKRAERQARRAAFAHQRRRAQFMLIGLAIAGGGAWALQGEPLPIGLLGIAAGILLERLTWRGGKADGGA
ncbi:MAG TPA: hypothetical protein VLA56_19755 [Pseudomonadales bacterium]|nr:hypothetical protein [Pseudomonadales bacterium]